MVIKLQGMQKKKVLFVDDDPDILDIVSFILEEEDIDLIKAPEIPAVADIVNVRPDLILLDEWLPGKAGSMLCKELKGKKSTSHIPVILISAVFSLETIAAECRADGFISKPFDIGQLKQVVSDCLAVA